MSRLVPLILSPREQYQDDLWMRNECYRFYVQQRRTHCNFMQLMDLWLQVPYCTSCEVSSPFGGDRLPDIEPANWEEDFAWTLGEDILNRVKAIVEDSDFTLLCNRCGSHLRPWEDDYVYVISRHLEEDYSIPLETGAKRNPPKKLRNKIIELYDRRCFNCGSTGPELHIDHILPRSKGGDAAFRNLQPLCSDCGFIKNDSLPEEVAVYCDIHFGPYPSDSYEGLFWSVDETL